MAGSCVQDGNWWRRRELNPRPKNRVRSIYKLSARFTYLRRPPGAGSTSEGSILIPPCANRAQAHASADLITPGPNLIGEGQADVTATKLRVPVRCWQVLGFRV